jgi:hypothetical protein
MPPHTTGFFYDPTKRRYGVIRNKTAVILPLASVKRILRASGHSTDSIRVLLMAARVIAGVRIDDS